VYSLACETMAFGIPGIENAIRSGIGFYWGPETASEFIQDITDMTRKGSGVCGPRRWNRQGCCSGCGRFGEASQTDLQF
jgi:hypothetical protein